MNKPLDDFLYKNPDLYEAVFPSRQKSDLCIEIFEKHLQTPPSSILEVACGTGRDLSRLSTKYPDCTGFDVEPNMVSYARRRNPGLAISIGDMRTHRLDRAFDAICALGGSINFALTNEDLDKTVETYRAHAHPGTLLFLQPLNSGDFFGQFKAPEKFSGSYNDTVATGTATYNISKIHQLIERTRTWRIEGEGTEFTDFVKFRIIFPAELSYILGHHGFEVLEIFEQPAGQLYTTSMFVVARYVGNE